MDKNEIINWLKVPDPAELFKKADEIRRRVCGDEIHLRGLIEFSNYCSRDCLYCGLRRSNENLTRYRMPLEEILEINIVRRNWDIKL